MFSKELEELIEATLVDGTLSDAERRVLHKRAAAEGVDLDELDVILDGRLAKLRKQQAAMGMTPPQVPTPSSPSSSQYGSVMKCPSCGAQVLGGSAVCQACGYAFSNVSASTATMRLQAKIDEFNRRQEGKSAFVRAFMGGDLQALQAKVEMISTFPVPNTRADLLDLMSMIDPLIDVAGPRNGYTAGGENLGYGYWVLFSNCINKARISFSKDPDFAHFFSRHAAEMGRTKGFAGWWRTRSQLIKVLLILAVVWVAIIALLIILGVFSR